MIKPLVSVVIPTYKRPKMINEAIKSVLNQTYEKWELIIVDDNDSDSKFRKQTIKTLKEYRKYNNIKYIKHKNNKGGAIARNTGIENAKGEYVAFLDDDDKWTQNKLCRQVDKFFTSEFKEDLGFVYCKIKYIDEKKRKIKNHQKMVNGNILSDHLISGIAPTSSLLVKREALNEINGFRNLDCKQEYDLILRILLRGFKADYVDEELLIVYVHKKNRISNNPKRINGTKYMYNFKSNYFYLLNKDQLHQTKINYLKEIFHFSLKIQGRKQAIKHLYNIIKFEGVGSLIIKEIFIFIFGYKLSLKIKRFIDFLS